MSFLALDSCSWQVTSFFSHLFLILTYKLFADTNPVHTTATRRDFYLRFPSCPWLRRVLGLLFSIYVSLCMSLSSSVFSRKEKQTIPSDFRATKQLLSTAAHVMRLFLSLLLCYSTIHLISILTSACDQDLIPDRGTSVCHKLLPKKQPNLLFSLCCSFRLSILKRRNRRDRRSLGIIVHSSLLSSS